MTHAELPAIVYIIHVGQSEAVRKLMADGPDTSV